MFHLICTQCDSCTHYLYTISRVNSINIWAYAASFIKNWITVLLNESFLQSKQLIQKKLPLKLIMWAAFCTNQSSPCLVKYQNSAVVKTNHGMSEPFNINQHISQNCTTRTDKYTKTTLKTQIQKLFSDMITYSCINTECIPLII